MAVHGLVRQGKATVFRRNANRRDVVFNTVFPSNIFEAGAVTPELQRLQWNPNAASPYPARLIYRDREAGLTGGGAGPHLKSPEDFTYWLRIGPFQHSFMTPASDTQEPYELNLDKALFDWLNSIVSNTELDFSVLNTAAWGDRDIQESFDVPPESAAGDYLDGVVAVGLEIPALDLRYWSLDIDATIDGKVWVGDSRLSVAQQTVGVTNSNIVIDVRVGPEQVPDRGAILGNDVFVRWFVRRNGRWARIPNSFPGKVANIRLSGLVMTLTIDPGPYPQTIDQRRFSNEDQQTLHPGDRFFEYVNKWKERPKEFQWPFFIQPIPTTKREGGALLTTRPVPENSPVVLNDFSILLPPSPISTTPLRYAPVRTPISVVDPEGDRTTLKFVVDGITTDARSITGTNATHILAGNAVVSTRTTAAETNTTDTITLEANDPDGSNKPVRRTGTISAPNRAYTRIACRTEAPTLFFTSGQQDVRVDISTLAGAWNRDFGFRVISIGIPPANSDDLSYSLATTGQQQFRHVVFDVGTVTEEKTFQITWTAQHTIGDTDPTVCRANVVIRPDTSFSWTDERVAYTVRQPEADADIPNHRVFLDGFSNPRTGNTIRVKTAPDATKATATYNAQFNRLEVDFVDPYPFPDPLPNNYEGDKFTLVMAGRRTIPAGGDASLPLYAEDDLTVEYTALPAGATLSGNACEITIRDKGTSTDNPYDFNVGIGSGSQIDLIELIYPTAGGGGIRFNPNALEILEATANNPEIFTLSYDNAEEPGVVVATGSGLGRGTGIIRVKNTLCPDETAVTIYIRGQSNIIYAIWPQKVVPNELGIRGLYGVWLQDHWGIPATPGNLGSKRGADTNNPQGSPGSGSLIVESDRFIPFLGEGIRFLRIFDWNPEYSGGEYAHVISVNLEPDEAPIGKRRSAFYYAPTGATYQQDVLISPHATHDIIEAPAQPGPPYIFGEGFVGGITPGNVLSHRPGVPGVAQGTPFNLTMPTSSWATWLALADGLVAGLGTGVLPALGGQAGLSGASNVYSSTQFIDAEVIARSVNSALTQDLNSLVSIGEFDSVIQAQLIDAWADVFATLGGNVPISSFVTSLVSGMQGFLTPAQAQAAASIVTATTFGDNLASSIATAQNILSSGTEAVTGVGSIITPAISTAGVTVTSGQTVSGVTVEGSNLTSNLAVPAAGGADIAATVVRSVWQNIGSIINLFGWFRTFHSLMTKLLESQAVRISTVDPNIATVTGVVRSGTLVGGGRGFTLEGRYYNPGETMLTATGIVNGKPWKNVILPVILRVLNPETDWRDG